jgi:gas vesicle structural protein
MTIAAQQSGGALERPSSSGLADVIDSILDKGLVIDAYVRVSLVGIELLTIDARIVVASVDTYLRFAEAANRVDLSPDEQQGLPGMMQNLQEGGAKGKTKGVIDAVKDGVRDAKDSRDEDRDEEDEYEARPRRRRRSKED